MSDPSAPEAAQKRRQWGLVRSAESVAQNGLFYTIMPKSFEERAMNAFRETVEANK